MIGYILEGTGPQGGSTDKRMARLAGAGPWQFQPHQLGTLATWRAAGPVPRAAFGTERKTVDGLRYLPPKVLPTPATLIRPAMANRMDLTEVVVSSDTGVIIKILPCYMSPRQIMEDNTLGEYSNVYGRAVRTLLDRVSDNPKTTIASVAEDLAECCRLAILHTYRMTRELLTDLGWLNEESLQPIWEAAIKGPKAIPAEDGGKSG